jgi:hypothetical protein
LCAVQGKLSILELAPTKDGRPVAECSGCSKTFMDLSVLAFEQDRVRNMKVKRPPYSAKR